MVKEEHMLDVKVSMDQEEHEEGVEVSMDQK